MPAILKDGKFLAELSLLGLGLPRDRRGMGEIDVEDQPGADDRIVGLLAIRAPFGVASG